MIADTTPAVASTVAAPAQVPEIKDIVANILLQGVNAVKDGAEWMKGQIPDVIQQFIHWKIAENAIGLSLWLLLAFATAYGMYRMIKAFTKDEGALSNTDGGALVGMSFFLIVIGLTFLGCAYCDLKDLVQLLVAPKVYLLEYAADLIKSNH